MWCHYSKRLASKIQGPIFSIPDSIGALSMDNALLDLGASINLIPLEMLKKIGEWEIKPTKIMLQSLQEKMILTRFYFYITKH